MYFQVNDRVIDLEIDVYEKCIYMAYLASDASHKVSEFGNLKLSYLNLTFAKKPTKRTIYSDTFLLY